MIPSQKWGLRDSVRMIRWLQYRCILPCFMTLANLLLFAVSVAHSTGPIFGRPPEPPGPRYVVVNPDGTRTEAVDLPGPVRTTTELKVVPALNMPAVIAGSLLSVAIPHTGMRCEHLSQHAFCAIPLVRDREVARWTREPVCSSAFQAGIKNAHDLQGSVENGCGFFPHDFISGVDEFESRENRRVKLPFCGFSDLERMLSRRFDLDRAPHQLFLDRETTQLTSPRRSLRAMAAQEPSKQGSPANGAYGILI